MRRMLPTLILLACCLPAVAQNAGQADTAARSFSSGNEQVALLELFTSEGCSSCPPAEAWFAKLLQRPDLWQRIVPVVFHVDYWNNLGWKDPFSTADNSQRQRRYRAEGGVRSVYTPGFVLNGREWRGWFSGEALPDSDQPAGRLSAEVSNGAIQATYHSPDCIEPCSGRPAPLELHIALLGFDLTTTVTRGENRGKRLTHQFVVIDQASNVSSDNTWSMALPKNPTDADQLALALWITQPGTQRPLQATGGWLQDELP